MYNFWRSFRIRSRIYRYFFKIPVQYRKIGIFDIVEISLWNYTYKCSLNSTFRISNHIYRYFFKISLKYRKTVFLIELRYRFEVTHVGAAWWVRFESKIRFTGIILKYRYNTEKSVFFTVELSLLNKHTRPAWRERLETFIGFTVYFLKYR